MQFKPWDALFNTLILIFWFRIWSRDTRAAIVNPYLASLNGLSDSILRFLKPAFFFLSERMIAVTALLFLLALRALAAPHESYVPTGYYGGWQISMVFERHAPGADSINAYLLFSVLPFARFLFKLWGLSLLYVRTDTHLNSQHTTDAFHHLSRPFSRLRYEWRPAVLFVFGILLALVLTFVGPEFFQNKIGKQAPLAINNVINIAFVLRCAILALATWVSALSVLYSFVIILIIGSWAGMFMGHQGIMYFSQDWMALLMGPLGKYPIRIGMLDLAPLVFILLLHFIIQFLTGILWFAFTHLP